MDVLIQRFKTHILLMYILWLYCTYLLKKFSIRRNSWILFLFDGGWSLKIASARNFKMVIVVPSILCRRNFTLLREKCVLSGVAFMFSFNKI